MGFDLRLCSATQTTRRTRGLQTLKTNDDEPFYPPYKPTTPLALPIYSPIFSSSSSTSIQFVIHYKSGAVRINSSKVCPAGSRESDRAQRPRTNRQLSKPCKSRWLGLASYCVKSSLQPCIMGQRLSPDSHDPVDFSTPQSPFSTNSST